MDDAPVCCSYLATHKTRRICFYDLAGRNMLQLGCRLVSLRSIVNYNGRRRSKQKFTLRQKKKKKHTTRETGHPAGNLRRLR